MAFVLCFTVAVLQIPLIMVALWNILWFLSIFYLFFPRLISVAAHWMSTVLPRLSVNLECRSEMCCMWLAENTGCRKVAKNRHLGIIAQLCRAMSLQ